jgi:Uma2 family endonuclease
MLVAERNIEYPQKLRSSRKIPEILVYEILEGRKIYYKGYKDVLKGLKTPEEIFNKISFRAVIVQYFMGLLIKNFDESIYWFFSGESGVHIDHRNNIAHDVAVYSLDILPPNAINVKYPEVPAEFVVEIDVKADLSDPKDFGYVQRKTNKIIEFGTKKVIWIFTDTQKVLIAEPSKYAAWQIYDWDVSLELSDGVMFNVKEYLLKKGITIVS